MSRSSAFAARLRRAGAQALATTQPEWTGRGWYSRGYSTTGAQSAPNTTVPGGSIVIGISAEGTTTARGIARDDGGSNSAWREGIETCERVMRSRELVVKAKAADRVVTLG